MTIEEGCEVIVNTCMGVRPDDKAVIATDKETMEIGKELRRQVLEKTNDVRFYNLDIYGERPLDKLPEQIKQETEAATVTFFAAQTVKGELDTVRMPFFNAGVMGGRHAHMMGLTKEILERGINVDYERIAEFTEELHSMVKEADEIRVKAENGTDFTAKIGKYKWVAATGISRTAGDWQNLPDGEVYTAPDELEGTAVIDGTMGDYFSDKFSLERIEENPLKLEIQQKERPTVVDVECSDDELKQEFLDYINQHECSSWIGEIGIGTNIFLEEMIGNILMDEKHPTIHLAVGDPNDNMTFAGWTCSEHMDLLIQNSTIWLDDEKIMEKGDFLIE